MTGLLTYDEVAAELRVHRKTVARWVQQGRLPAVRTPGGMPRVRREDVARLLEPVPAGEVPPAARAG